MTDGKWVHARTVGRQWGKYQKAHFAKTGRTRRVPGKHKYLYPLDDEIRQRIEPLRQPYPKRPKDSSEPSGFHPEEGGAAPTRALQTTGQIT